MYKDDLFNELVNKIELLISLTSSNEEHLSLARMRLDALDIWHAHKNK